MKMNQKKLLQSDICIANGRAGFYHDGKVHFPDGTTSAEEPDLVLRVMEDEPPIQINEMLLPDLEYGSRGLFVWMMQALLNWHGYKVQQDGALGFKTLAALREFRKQNYLDGDTVCDSVTWRYLMTE